MILDQHDVKGVVRAMETFGCRLIRGDTVPNQKDPHLPTERLTFELTWYADDKFLAVQAQKEAEAKKKVQANVDDFLKNKTAGVPKK